MSRLSRSIGALPLAFILVLAGCGSTGGNGGGGSSTSLLLVLANRPDTKAPVASVTVDQDRIGSQQQMVFTIGFSEAVAGFDPATAAVITGGSLAGVAPAGNGWQVTVTAGSHQAAAQVTLSVPAGSYTDLAGNPGVTTASRSVPLVPTWTVFVYGHADHNLGDNLAADLLEMAGVATGGRLRVLVLADWNASLQAAVSAGNLVSGTGFPGGAHWYRVDDGNAVGLGSVEYLGEWQAGAEFDLDDPLFLVEAVRRAFATVPADRRAVILFDHGGGWAGGYGQDSQDGTVTNPHALPAELAIAAVGEGLVQAGVTAVPPLDVLAFEACLLGTTEVAEAATGTAQVLIANADVAWGQPLVHGFFDHRGFLTAIAASPRADSATLAAAEVAGFDARRLISPLLMSRLVRAHAAIDLRLWPAFRTAMGGLRSLLMAYAPVDISRSLFQATPGYGISDAEYHERVPTGDAGTLLAALTAWGGALGSQAQTARNALAAAIPARSLGSVRLGVGTQLGLGLEMAISKEWLNLDGGSPVYNWWTDTTVSRRVAYPALASDWRAATAWDQVLDRAAFGDDLSGFTITGSIVNGVNPTSSAKPQYHFSVPEQDLTHGQIGIFVGIPGFPDLVCSTGLVMDQHLARLAPGWEYVLTWDGTCWTMGDGVNDAFAPIRPYVSGAYYAVDGRFSVGAQSTEGSLLIERGTAAILGIVERNGSSVVGRNRSDLPAGTMFQPYVTVIHLSTGDIEVIPSSTPLSLSNLTMARMNAEATDYLLLLRLDDAWGNSSFDAQIVSVGAPFGDA